MPATVAGSGRTAYGVVQKTFTEKHKPHEKVPELGKFSHEKTAGL
jgi:hypothetical protein